MQPDIIPGETSTSTVNIPNVDLAVNSPLAGLFDGLSFYWFSKEGVLEFLSSIWDVYVILAYIFCLILLVLYVYASIQKNLYADIQTQALRDGERLFNEKYRGGGGHSRVGDMVRHADSDNPNDWKLAIIEADIILDEILKQRGYAGVSLGERLKSVSPTQLATLNDAWEAHKVRNRIAHEGADFVLTKRVAQETIGRYQRVFNEFGVT